MSPLQGLKSLPELALSTQERPQINERLGEIGFDAEGFAERRDCQIDLSAG